MLFKGSRSRPTGYSAGKTTVTALLVTGFLASTLAGADISPDAGQETREIKALSHEEVVDLRAGKGMGYAKVAELNGYPGPAHVLELADRLGLSTEQRARTQAIYDRMTASAKALGAELIEAERSLEAMFAERRVEPARLQRGVEQSARIQAQLRTVHLTAHLRQIELLSPAQVERYLELRGYSHSRHHR